MRIEEYLSGIKECENVFVEQTIKDHTKKIPKLTFEYGIYDNYPIFFHKEPDAFRDIMLKNEQYVEDGIPSEPGSYIKHVPTGNQINLYRAPIRAQLLKWASSGGTMWAYGLDTDPLKIEHGIKQLKDYDGLMILHDRYDKEILERTNSLVELVSDISEIFRANSIPFCFSQSNGWGHKDDMSRIVYYSPKTEESAR
jgi:hypothetical protein